MKKWYTRIKENLHIGYTVQYRPWWLPVYVDMCTYSFEFEAKDRIDYFLKEQEYGTKYTKYPD